MNSCLLFLCRPKPSSVLKQLLDTAPMRAQDVSIKMKAVQQVKSILSAIKEPEMKTLCESMDERQLDILMQYVYACMSTGENGALFLKWHAAVYNAAGVGSIVRALSDRHSVTGTKSAKKAE